MWKLLPAALALFLTTPVLTRAQSTPDAALGEGRDLFATYCAHDQRRQGLE